MELPRQLRANRERLGLSQEDVAHAIYVSRQTMSSWENGKTYPDVQSLMLLSHLFGISIDELVMLMGIACMVGLNAVWKDPSPVPYMSIGSLAGIAAMVAFWIPSLVLSVRIEQVKKNHDLVTYREISAFMDGEEVPEESKALSRSKPLLSNIVKLVCGAGIGLIVAFVLTLIVNALH